LQLKGFSDAVTTTILQAKRPSSLKLYDSYVGRWQTFCHSHGYNYVFASVPQGLDFLQSLLDGGLGYSALNTARSALSAVLILPQNVPFGSQNEVKLFMKGAFNQKPPTPRYVSTWDPSQVLKFLESWTPASDLSLEKLTIKTILLILLVTGQRTQIITSLDLNSMKKSSDSFEFAIKLTDLKQGRANYKPKAILLKQYETNKKLCIFHYLSIYLQRTALLRKSFTKVFLTTKKPHRPVSKNSVSRWVKNLLGLAGIDTNIFSAGSTRAAATSKAMSQGANIDQILSMGGWSNLNTFNKFYNRPILQPDVALHVLHE
jgi:integrase